MTIEEHRRLWGNNPPLPNEIIELSEIPNLKFYNTSYREYLAVYGEYIIKVYPFAVGVERSFLTDGSPVTYDSLKLAGARSHQHHNDFISGKIDIDPCDIYEVVSGTKIHSGGSDSYLMNKEHSGDIRGFESFILSIKRDSKLKEIGI